MEEISGGASTSEDGGNLMMELPPGFRFHPTDEEIITHYLRHKVFNASFSAAAIADADFNKCEPWDLPKKAKMGEKEWYFFSQRDRKYPTGMRTNRATESGYWKATGKDKEIFKLGQKGCLVGMKKTLVFYLGRAPKGNKSNWVMHEFRLQGHLRFSTNNYNTNLPNDEWVVCRVFHKSSNNNNNINMIKKTAMDESLVEEMLEYSNSLPPLTDDYVSSPNTTISHHQDHDHQLQQQTLINPPASWPDFSCKPEPSVMSSDNINNNTTSEMSYHHHFQDLDSSFSSLLDGYYL